MPSNPYRQKRQRSTASAYLSYVPGTFSDGPPFATPRDEERVFGLTADEFLHYLNGGDIFCLAANDYD
ncbi:MAG: hypothetical protein H6907_21115 [Hyphomicrobiales bacterium]|nr:hypothetical protein [Hyphomicrobiales bacterium]MCP5374244.1 hypothetical protein [Hyphomicrobiales bacterium]